MRAFTLVLALVLVSAPASADWKKIGTTNPNDWLMAFSALGDREFFVGGLSMDSSSGFPKMAPVLYWTQDDGKLFKSAVGGLATAAGFGASVSALAFLDSKQGWAVAGSAIWRTVNTGGQWKPAKVTGTPTLLHRFDEATGVALGEGGAAWRTADGGASWTEVATGTTADLSGQQWLDASRGFACGTVWETSDDGQGNELQTAKSAVVLKTSNGGASWSVLSEVTGRVAGPVFFLPDGQTGWLSTSAWDTTNSRAGPADLRKSTDGGASFVDTGFDPKVGTVSMGFQMPINASYITVMRWDDEARGHLAGSAYVTETSSGGGSPTPIYRNVDFVTLDGGATWKRTDLGSISIDLGGGAMPAGDGRIMSGALRSLFSGWMAGEGGAVYEYEYTCKTHEDCGYGYGCGSDGKCIALILPDACTSCGSPDAATADADATATQPDGTGAADVSCGQDGCPGASSGGGCSAGSPAASAALLILLAIAFLSVAFCRDPEAKSWL